MGNVEGRLMRGGRPARGARERADQGRRRGLLAAEVRPTTTELQSGDTLVMATDGIAGVRERWSPASTAQELAERILAEHGRGTDDALAVVVRYLGPPARP